MTQEKEESQKRVEELENDKRFSYRAENVILKAKLKSAEAVVEAARAHTESIGDAEGENTYADLEAALKEYDSGNA